MNKPIPVDTEKNDYIAELVITQHDGETLRHQLPVLIDTHGQPYLQTSGLFDETGYILYDEGLRSTAIAESKITRINPCVKESIDKVSHGVLQYRGYSVKQLATTCTFLESSYLLIYGDMPNEETFKTFSEDIKINRVLDKTTESLIEHFDKQSDPMIILSAALASLAARYEREYDMQEPEDRYKIATRLIAKMPTIATQIFKHNIGQRPIDPDESLGHAANFLHMLLSTTTKNAEPEPNHIKILDMILTLHADHQMAVSTFVARCVSSAKSPSISSIIAANLALAGPLHGGANLKVIELLSTLTEEDIPKILMQAKNPEDPFKLPGFGHRVYEGIDPRAEVLRELTHTIIKNHPEEEALYTLALQLEQSALSDPYFTDRNLFPNVDFYSGLALKAIGIPEELFTVIFSISRVSGWLAHIEEAWENESPLFRPKQYYTGLKERPLHWP